MYLIVTFNSNKVYFIVFPETKFGDIHVYRKHFVCLFTFLVRVTFDILWECAHEVGALEREIITLKGFLVSLNPTKPFRDFDEIP